MSFKTKEYLTADSTAITAIGFHLHKHLRGTASKILNAKPKWKAYPISNIKSVKTIPFVAIQDRLQNTRPLKLSLNLLLLWSAVCSQPARLYLFTKCLTELVTAVCSLIVSELVMEKALNLSATSVCSPAVDERTRYICGFYIQFIM